MDNAPHEWVAYAQRMSRQFELALEGRSELARDLHAAIEASPDVPAAGANATRPPTVRVKTWLDASGTVLRVQFDSLGDSRVDADLGERLVGLVIGTAPPVDMKQPVIVRLKLVA